jgi:hypothetical protein
MTYTNVVGSLALFIALGGVSWAATLPKNSVGSKQLKSKAVTEKKLSKSSVTSSAIKDGTIADGDFKNGALSGAKINVAGLGAVPKANAAGHAASTDDILPPVVKRLAPSADNANSTTALHDATAVTLLKVGAASVIAKCFTSGSSTYAYIILRSAKDGTIVSNSIGSQNFYGSPFLNPGRPDENSYLGYTSTGGNGANYMYSSGYNYYGAGTMADVDGNGMQFQANGWVKTGTLPSGNGVYGAGSVCLFTASGTKLSPG